MPLIQFKLINKEGTVRLATFQEHPTWEELAARVHHYYDIPLADVAVSYTDSEGDQITVTSDEELQDYYSTIPVVHTHAFKLNVIDLRPKRPPRPPTDILLNLDEQWTPMFTAVPLTPSQLHEYGETGAHIEEIVDEEDEKRSTRQSGIEELLDEEDVKSYLNIPGRQPPAQEQDDADDASSIDSILDNDLPDKQPIHVFPFSDTSNRAPSASSLSRSSTKSKSAEGSRSISSDETHRFEKQFDMVAAEQFKSPRQSEFDILDDIAPVDNHLVDPARGRSRSRSPLRQSQNIPSPEPSVGRYSTRSSRVISEHPTPVIPTIDTTSPRGAPASFDMRSIPSPEPIVIQVPPILEESVLVQETADMTISAPDPPLPTLPQTDSPSTATTTTTPSLTNDIASLLDALTRAFDEHPELSEGLRNIVRNASQGVYWNNATDAIRSIRDTVVSDALQARDVIMTESASGGRDISSQAQAEAGRRIAEALGNVFRSLGTVLGSSAFAAPTESALFSGAASAPQAPTQTQRQEPRTRGPGSFLGAPRAESPPLIKATPLIHGQDIPPDARSLSRPSSSSSSPDRGNKVYSSSSVRVPRRDREEYGYRAPQYIPVVWGPPPPPRGPNGERNAYGPPPPPVAIPSPLNPYAYNRSGHHRSQSSAAGASAYPPPAGPPPPGAFYVPGYPSSPYGQRYPPPDPRMYMDPRDYGRNGYPGIGAGANMRRSNTLPPSFPVNPGPPPPPPPPPAPATVIVQQTPHPSQPQPPPPVPIVPPPPPTSNVVAARSPTPSFGAASTTETPGSSVVVVPASAVTKKTSLDDTYLELEEAKRIYKEKKEEYRREREERKIQKEKERAERLAEREARRLARLTARGQQHAPQPPVATLKAPSIPDNASGSESGTEKALPIPPQRGAAGPATSTPQRSSTERLQREVNDRLNAMGFTNRSYPQLNTLVPMHVHKHAMLSKGEVPDEVIVQHVLEDIFVPNLSSSTSKI